MGNGIGLGLLSMSVCFDFRSTKVGSSVIGTGRIEGSLLPYFYRSWCHYPLITDKNHVWCTIKREKGAWQSRLRFTCGSALASLHYIKYLEIISLAFYFSNVVKSDLPNLAISINSSACSIIRGALNSMPPLKVRIFQKVSFIKLLLPKIN